ncbi:MAG TPA: OB-fold nucleic acid binding domain-containing protein [Pyrinomonadaceae bacterium]|jgi:hypothetical protein|nr:OB-fold nucleic acid binding domain-containing protein [Pyrinomonadaceae bacterium]
MRSFVRPVIFAAVFVVALSTAAFAKTSINKINADPGRYYNKKVTIEGRVTDSYGVLGEGAYEIDDGTGRIWVVAERAVPARGSYVEAKGHVVTGFVYRGRNLAAAIRETGRKAKDKH